MKNFTLLLCLMCICLTLASKTAFGESQGEDYKGISDPFGDPTNYEFSEDEKEDKEFFHLGRYVMFGFDLGAGIYTAGLGASNTPGFYFGAHLVYFFDKQIAIEAAGHYANSLDTVNPSATQLVQINTDLIPITLAFRYYFDTKNAPKAIAVANPYLLAGAGLYLRNQTVIQNVGGLAAPNGSTSSFGAFGGGGVEFAIYDRHIYFGIDLRYHFVFWPDTNDTFHGLIPAGSRSGDYVTACGTLTYNF